MDDLNESNSSYEPFSASCESEYVPSEYESLSAVNAEVDDQCLLKSRKRLSNPSSWKVNVRKRSRNSGKQYVTKQNKIVPEKKFTIFQCNCSKRCDTLFSLEQRQKIFSKYYELADFNLQTSLICGRVQVLPKKRTYTKNTTKIRREFTRHYSLLDERGTEINVCKTFFIKSLAISNGRLSRALRGKESGSPPHLDNRGKAPSMNKTSIEKTEEVIKFINDFPSYSSHYGRTKAGSRKYLAPDLNIRILYDLYKNKDYENPVSEFVFRKIFNEKFNLHFHPPITDSCKKCDMFEMKIKSSTNEDNQTLIIERDLHHRKAEAARNGMIKDAELGKTDNSITVIAFDLMKTLPTPVISTGICYYKRQLWTYNLGIHNLSTNDAYMYVWNESVASRGSQEIASCLIHFVKNYVQTKKLIMYSDQCGGQNRNIKMYGFCNYIVLSPDLIVNEIDHKFLLSGHSYLACDEDFGLIEKCKKQYRDIFIPEDWIKVIQSAKKKNPFKIVKMTSNDFFSSQQLEDTITKRKLNLEKAKVEWLKIQWIRVTCNEPCIMKYKYSNNEDVLFNEVNFAKRSASSLTKKLNLLFPNGREIDKIKLKDLKDLLPYIPPVHHKFYTNLAATQGTSDDFGIFGDAEFNND